MSQPIHTTAPEVMALVNAAFPGYAGRKVTLRSFSGPLTLSSYWSGGTRDRWGLVNIATGRAMALPENGSGYGENANGLSLSALPEGAALVQLTEGSFSCVTLYVNPANLAPLLPAPVGLSWGERVALCAAISLTSSYRRDAVNRDCGMTPAEYETAKAALAARGFLRSNGSVTDAGRNACQDRDLWAIGKRATEGVV